MKKTALVAVLFALVATACSGNTVTTVVEPSVTSSTSSTTAAPTTTIDPDQAVVFGSGSIPETMPVEFPFPTEAVIGSTLIDRNRSLTEVIFRVPASVQALADFFEANLPGRNFVIDSSIGGETEWDIEFSGELGTGQIAITFGSQDVSEAVVRLTAAG